MNKRRLPKSRALNIKKEMLTHRFESPLVDHGEGPMSDEVFGVELVDANGGERHPGGGERPPSSQLFRLFSCFHLH